MTTGLMTINTRHIMHDDATAPSGYLISTEYTHAGTTGRAVVLAAAARQARGR